MYAMILLGVVALIVLLCAGIAALLGLSKTRAHLIIVFVCAAITLALGWLTKLFLPAADTVMTFVQGRMDWIGLKFGADAVRIAEQALEYAAISPTLVELVLQLSVAMLIPMLCLILFIVLALASGVVFSIVSLIKGIIRRKRAKQDEDEGQDERPRKSALSRLGAAGLGAVQGVIIAIMLLLPISCYLSIVQPTLQELIAQDVLPADDPTIVMAEDIVVELDASPVLNVYRTLGGRALSDSIMSMQVAGVNVKVSEELSSLIKLAQQAVELSKTELPNYGEEQAAIISSIGDSFADSKLLAPIAGDVIYAATDAWLKGEPFVNIERPSLGEDGEILEPALTALLEILHDDAKETLLLQADVKTVAELVSVLARNGVFANLSNTDALLETMGGNVVSEMVTTLGNNQSMKRMIPEIMNIGVRAIGQVLSIPADAEQVYDSFMNDVADTLNDVRDLPEQERVQSLSAELETAFDQAGVEIDEQVLDFYSAAIIEDLVDANPDREITPDDVQAFFILYAEGAIEENSTMRGKPRFDMLASNESDPFAGTVYEGMTEAERMQTAAVTVAALCVKLSALDPDDTALTKHAAELVEEAFIDLLADHPETLALITSVELTAPVSSSTTEQASSLQSTDELRKTTSVVTLESLLVDAKEIAQTITPETLGLDANAISAIFDTAVNLLDVLDGSEELDISTLASSVGTILDSLAETNIFGKDKTAELFTSVMQSETVRDAANLDMKTATEIAQKATEGEVNYTQTMNTVATSVNIMEKLAADGTISEQELVDLIRNLNSQTAGMIEVYVTPERLVDNKIPEKYSEISSDLIKSLFGYIADSDKSNSEIEAKALNQILNIALAAKESNDKKLFSSAPGAGDGKLPTATETVNILLDSKAVRHALVDVLTDGEQITVFDPYELSGKIKPESQDRADFLAAIDAYSAANPDVDTLTLNALAALFGIERNN